MGKLGASSAVRAIVTVILAFAGESSVAQQEWNSKTVEFHIPPQELTAALSEWSKQAGLQVIWLANGSPNSASLAKLQGRFEPMQALGLLLRDSGLTYSLINDRTAVIQERAKPTSPSTKVTQRNSHFQSSAGSSERFLTSLVSMEGSSSKDAEQGDAARTQEDSADDSGRKEMHGVPEILVVGSKISNADIQRTEDDPQPYVVFDRTQIERSNSSNLEEFLKTRLPMNAVQTTHAQSPGDTLGNQSSISLRGLGENQTLILVDGRRMPSVNRGGTFGQPDVNGIPLNSIERIEVLPSTASGIYGGGATGGVVNIITRRSTGFEFSADYGNSFDTDVASRRVDASLGLSLLDGRTYIQMIASHADSNPLLAGERDFAARGIELQRQNNPDELSAYWPPFGYTSNICAATEDGVCSTDPLVLDTGESLGSNRTFVPVGYAGPASDGGAALIANAGTFNLDLPNTVHGAGVSLLSNPTIQSASFNLRQKLASSLDAFIDTSWNENRSLFRFAGSGIPYVVTLPADAPNNPFNSPIAVNFPAVGLAQVNDSTSETLRVATGLIARLPFDWTAGADYVWSRSRYSLSYTDPVIGDPDAIGISPSAALADGTLDVMRDINAYPLDFSPYLLPSPNRHLKADTILQDAALRLSGPVIALPGGALTLSGQLAWREEEARDAYSDRINSSGVPSVTFYPSVSQRVNSYYLEARAPVFSDRNGGTFIRALEVQASLRRDEYETEVPNPSSATLSSRSAVRPTIVDTTNKVEATKYTIGLRYAPIEDFALRASFGTGFLPPSVAQVRAPTVANTSASLVDPKRGGIASLVRFSQALNGNPNLEPEESESWSLGAVFTPRVLAGLRLSLDYTRITKNDEIRRLEAQDILSLEDRLPGRVTRAPLTAADAARGYSGGVITSIDRSFVNLSDSRLDAYDLQLDYTLKGMGGELQFYTIATYQPHYENRVLPTTPFFDSAGYSGGPLKWRGNAGLIWNRDALTVGWSTQYYDSYFIFPASSDQATTEFNIDYYMRNQGALIIPSQIYHDVFARYEFDGFSEAPGSALSNIDITIGVQNVMDESPPILATTFPVGGYSTYGDPRLRRYSLTVRKSF